jgi:hypothetical protein
MFRSDLQFERVILDGVRKQQERTCEHTAFGTRINHNSMSSLFLTVSQSNSPKSTSTGSNGAGLYPAGGS